jgi:hypothetical protein
MDGGLHAAQRALGTFSAGHGGPKHPEPLKVSNCHTKHSYRRRARRP